ncbi:unnamed protein product [Somion occarium]|uniref:Uncharacterized protein n=1 Tax=Somion occarium TaxID=3059160 RepID=A0ABP1DC21_9APHY
MLHGLLRSFLSSACHTDVWGVVPTFPPHFVLIFSGDPEVDTLVIGLPASLHDKAYLISSFSWPDQGCVPLSFARFLKTLQTRSDDLRHVSHEAGVGKVTPPKGVKRLFAYL